MDYKKLTDDQLEIYLQTTVQKENLLKTQILHLLAEVERRRLYSKSYPSLFEYCVKTLKYSPASTQRRIDTMRAMKLIPEIEHKIASGELNLSNVAQAQSFFRQEAKHGKSYSVSQKKEVLKKLENKSGRECLIELATLSPSSIPQEKRRELTSDQTELKVVLDKDLIQKLDQIKNFLSHQNPHMTDKELIQAMAEICLKKLDPAQKTTRPKRDSNSTSATELIFQDISSNQNEGCNKIKIVVARTSNQSCNSLQYSFLKTLPELENKGSGNIEGFLPAIPMAKSLKSKKPSSPQAARYIPVTLKQEVYMRDRGQCTYKNPKTGERCCSRKFLEYDHIQPFAQGGPTNLQNLRLLCRTHNVNHAIDTYGFRKMQRYTKSEKESSNV